MSSIFINYRRKDSSSIAGRIRDHLVDRFGESRVFLDVCCIRPGQNWEIEIDRHLSKCHVFIAIIGNKWLAQADVEETSLNEPADYVRKEIESALGRGIVVIPVLVENASLPEELPDSLKSLAKHQWFDIRQNHFEDDVNSLMASIDMHLRNMSHRETQMVCISCGHVEKVSLGQIYAICGSCGHDNEILQTSDDMYPTDSLSPEECKKIKRVLKIAKIDLENRNYSEALSLYNKILNDYPEAWEVILNKSICLFWLGREDLSHLREVTGLLDKAALLSNNHPKIDVCRKSLAYSLSVIAEKKTRLGVNIMWSLDVFNISTSIAPDHETRDKLITQYCGECFDEIKLRLLGLLEKQKSRFDPPLTEVNTLYELALLTPTIEILSLFIPMAEHKIHINRNHGDLPQKLQNAVQLWQQLDGSNQFPQLKFPRFGKPYITL